MNRWSKPAGFALAFGCLFVLALAARLAIGQQSNAPPSVTPQTAERLVEKALPYLEVALGSKLDFAPKFRVVSATEFQALPNEDLDAHIRWHFPNLQGQTLDRTRQFARQIVSKAIVAQYVASEGCILIVAEHLPKIAAWDESLAGVNSDAFLQLALVHEMVRWHLDRRFQFAKLRAGCRDAEEWDALHTIALGRAQFVTGAVAAKLGTEKTFPLVAQCYVHVPDEAPDGSVKAISQTALHGHYRACAQGLAFFDALAAAKLGDVEGLAFTHLPRQMTVVSQPRRWLDVLKTNQTELEFVLKKMEGIMPADWQSLQQTWTPAMMAQAVSLLAVPPERTEKITASWYEGRSLICTQRKDPMRQLALNVVRHNDLAGARAHFGFLVDLEHKQNVLPASSCGPTIRVLDTRSSAIKLAGIDEAMRTDKRIAFGGAEPFPVSESLARAGNLVIECTWQANSADAALAERLIQALPPAAK
jgi:hypothetical protein